MRRVLHALLHEQENDLPSLYLGDLLIVIRRFGKHTKTKYPLQ